MLSLTKILVITLGKNKNIRNILGIFIKTAILIGKWMKKKLEKILGFDGNICSDTPMSKSNLR